MYELWQALGQVWRALVDLLVAHRGLLVTGLLIAIWVAWWLWAVDWRKVWPALRAGAWAPVVLLTLVAALVWSSLAPSTHEIAGLGLIPNYYWQLLATAAIVGLALICGWLQGYFHWVPPEVSFEPPARGHDDHHGHGHHGHGEHH